MFSLEICLYSSPTPFFFISITYISLTLKYDQEWMVYVLLSKKCPIANNKLTMLILLDLNYV